MIDIQSKGIKYYLWRIKVEALELVKLRRLVQEGISSGLSVDAELVFSRLRAKYAAMSRREEV